MSLDPTILHLPRHELGREYLEEGLGVGNFEGVVGVGQVGLEVGIEGVDGGWH
jgi:hypothetical protein